MEERNSFAKVEVGDRDAERKRDKEQIRDLERRIGGRPRNGHIIRGPARRRPQGRRV